MSFSDLVQPFLIVIQWSREYIVHIGCIYFSIFEFWTFCLVMTVVLKFLKWVLID
jgi:hypothetical protein